MARLSDTELQARLAAVLPPHSPFRDVAWEAVTDVSPAARADLARHLIEWFRFLGEMRMDPADATPVDVRAWLGDRRGSPRGSRVRDLRRLYRVASSSGLLVANPVQGVHWHAPTVRSEERISDEALQHLLRVADQRPVHAEWRIAARRDIVIGLLLAWRRWDPRDLLKLVWRDVALDAATPSLRAPDGEEPLPRAIVAAILEFRAELRRHGVEPIAEDALLPALGRRVEWSWRSPERPVLEGMTEYGLRASVKKLFADAGLERRAGTRMVVSLAWLHRDGRDLDDVLRSGTGATPSARRVPTLRLAGVPDSVGPLGRAESGDAVPTVPSDERERRRVGRSRSDRPPDAGRPSP